MMPQEAIPEQPFNPSLIETSKTSDASDDSADTVQTTESSSKSASHHEETTPESTISGNSWLGLLGNPHKQPDGQARSVLLCTTETLDESVQLTPIRKRRKRENHRNDPLVIECRKRKLEGVPLYRIAGDLTLDYLIVAKWDRRGWLDQQPLRKKGSPAEIDDEGND